MKLMLLGPPGAGKGTQAAKLCGEKGWAHISTGDILRAEMKNGTELGKMAKTFIDKGDLVPDDVIISMVLNRIKEDDCKEGFLLDGFPRTQAQAEALDAKLSLDVVICLEVTEDVLIKRLAGRRLCKECGMGYHINTMGDRKNCEKCGGELVQRKDDSEETIVNRMKVHAEQTEPLIAHYAAQGKLQKLDGGRSIVEVDADINKILDNLK